MSRELQPRLHMRHLDTELLGGDGAGHGGIDVADHDHQIGLFPQADLLEFDHDPGGLFGMAARPTSRSISGLGMPRSSKKALLMLLIIVLTGMHQQMLNAIRIAVHGLDDGSHFHEIRPRADDIKNLQFVPHSSFR